MASERTAATAGALLRSAREAQGLHIAALAASIKVSPRKLEALEGDRYDELASGTFTRALAQSVCRALRIDAQPVLALLPPPDAVALDNVTGTLNAPYRERGARDDQGLAATAQRSLLWAGAGLFVAAVVTFFVPGSWLRWGDGAVSTAASAVAPAASAIARAASAVIPVVAPVATAPTAASTTVGPAASDASAASAVSSASAAGPSPAPAAPPVAETAATSAPAPAAAEPASNAPLRLSASAPAWIEVRDGSGRIVFSRTLQAGEAAGVGGATPLQLVVGNATAVQLSYRGQVVDLAPSTRVNVARLVLN